MNKDLEISKQHLKVDKLGAFASIMCALHCIACAFIPATFTILGLEVFLEHKAEWLLTTIALIFASVALLIGWRSHRKTYIILLLGIGFFGLLAARGLELSDHHQIEKHEQHEQHEHDHHESEHTTIFIELIAIFSSLFLLVGHLMNLAEIKRVKQQCMS